MADNFYSYDRNSILAESRYSQGVYASRQRAKRWHQAKRRRETLKQHLGSGRPSTVEPTGGGTGGLGSLSAGFGNTGQNRPGGVFGANEGDKYGAGNPGAYARGSLGSFRGHDLGWGLSTTRGMELLAQYYRERNDAAEPLTGHRNRPGQFIRPGLPAGASFGRPNTFGYDVPGVGSFRRGGLPNSPSFPSRTHTFGYGRGPDRVGSYGAPATQASGTFGQAGSYVAELARRNGSY